jgi:tetratricopeptide (TPR) repeat protein
MNSKFTVEYLEVQYNSGELTEIGRWYENIGEIELAIAHYKKVISFGHGVGDHQAKNLLAFIYKRSKQYAHAIKLWEDISKNSLFSIEANIELAKLYEHVYKDYEKALFYAEKAQEGCQSIRKRGKLAHSNTNIKEELLYRLDRINRKIKGSNEVNLEYSLFS